MVNNCVLPFFFSLFDTATILLLIFSVFDISYKEYIGRIVLSVLGLTVLSTGLVFVGLHDYSLFILVPSLILTIIFGFNEKSVYSLWVSVVSLAVFLFLQQLLTYMFLVSGAMTPEDVQPFTTMGYVIQVMTFSISLGITAYHRKRGYYFMFSFNPKLKRSKVLPSNKPYVLSSTAIVLLIITFYPKFYDSPLNNTFYMILTGMIVSCALLIQLSIRREIAELKVT